MNSLEERREKATEEYKKVIDWALAEEDKVSNQLDKEGATRGLDTNKNRFAYIKGYEKKRLKEILTKYNLT